MEIPAYPFKDNLVPPCSETKGSFCCKELRGLRKQIQTKLTTRLGAELAQAVEPILLYPGENMMTNE